MTAMGGGEGNGQEVGAEEARITQILQYAIAPLNAGNTLPAPFNVMKTRKQKTDNYRENNWICSPSLANWRRREITNIVLLCSCSTQSWNA